MMKFFRKKKLLKQAEINKVVNLEKAEEFSKLLKYADKNKLVDEYTHTTLKAVSMGFRVEMVVGKRYWPNGVRVLAEVKEIYPNLLTVHASSIKTFDTAAQIGKNLLFGNRGDPYTYDVAKGIENCNVELLEHFENRFNQEKKDCIELKTKEEILAFADLIEQLQKVPQHKDRAENVEKEI